MEKIESKIKPTEEQVRWYLENGQCYEDLLIMVKEAKRQAIEATARYLNDLFGIEGDGIDIEGLINAPELKVS